MNPILIVDDNVEILEILQYHLKKNNYKVLAALSGYEALEILETETPDLIILDVMMNGIDGFSLCEQIRIKSTVPIMFLTAKTGEEDMIKGLMCGGDDYMSKPFSSKALLARVYALLRRKGFKSLEDDKDIVIGDLRIFIDLKKAYINNRRVPFTDIEFNTLLYLVDRRGEVVTPKEIFEHVWQEQFLEASKNTVVVHIKNIRKKIQAFDNDHQSIQTVWGKGYVIY